jgi:hypothetical protein
VATLNLQVTSGDDDAREARNDSGFAGTGTTIAIQSNADSGNAGVGGFRFLNVTVPQGATITAATWEPRVTSTATDDPDIDIHAEAVDDSASFVTSADVTGRSRTTASVAWTATAVGAAFVQSPDIATVIQEVVNRAGWVSGNDLTIIAVGRSGTSQSFTVRSFENGTGTDAAKLNITYTAGGGVNHKPLLLLGVG